MSALTRASHSAPASSWLSIRWLVFSICWFSTHAISPQTLPEAGSGDDIRPPENAAKPLSQANFEKHSQTQSIELDPAWLASIEHRTRLQPAETDSYYAILAHASEADYAAQKAAAKANVARHQHRFQS